MTILDRLSLLSNKLDLDTDNLKIVDISCLFFMNSLPIQVSQDYYVPTAITNAGLKCGTKYSAVIRNGVPCRRIQSAYKELAKNADSQFRASSKDPVFYKEGSKLYVIPDPTVDEEAFVVKLPVKFIEDYEAIPSTIPNIPENAIDIVLLYAAFLILSRKFQTKRGTIPTFPAFNDTINDYTISFPVIGDITVDTTLSFAALDALTPTDVDIADYSTPTSEINEAISALQKASSFIGSLTTDGGGVNTPTQVPTGAFWLDDEDPEMVQSAVQLASGEIQRANAYFGKQVSGLNAYSTVVQSKVTEFSNKVQAEIAKLNAKVQKMQVEAQTKALLLQKHGLSVQEVQTGLQKFQVDVSQRLQGNQQKLERYAQSLQGFQLEYTQLFQESMSFYERYRTEFFNFLNQYESSQSTRKG